MQFDSHQISTMIGCNYYSQIKVARTRMHT